MRVLAALVLASATVACGPKPAPYDHTEEHPEGHDHHASGHGHDEAVVRITRWSETFELFAEHEPAVAGEEFSMLAHLTILDGFRPVEAAKVHVELEGPSAVRASALGPIRPGIFEIPLQLPTAGEYRGQLVVSGPFEGVIAGLEIVAYKDAAGAEASVKDIDEAQFIEFLKEQQWAVEFGTEYVTTATLAAAVEVAGSVDTPPDGSAEVGAPVAGQVVAGKRGLPRPGDQVERGQLLATLIPAPAAPEASAQTGLALAEARARLDAATVALQRAQRLIRDGAISKREHEDAEREVAVARQALQAAERAQRMFSGASSGRARGTWRLSAPISGVLVAVEASPGGTVSPGQVLFRIIDPSELWIRAKLPEPDAARLRTDRDAAFSIAGLEQWWPLSVTGEQPTAKIVSVSRVVDPKSRTVDVIYGLQAPDPRVRVGAQVTVSLPVGDDFHGIVIDRSAVVEADGSHHVYVQIDGEHFEERMVATGPRSGDQTAIASGLQANERIVVRGAQLVRLAGRASSSTPHGHIH